MLVVLSISKFSIICPSVFCAIPGMCNHCTDGATDDSGRGSFVRGEYGVLLSLFVGGILKRRRTIQYTLLELLELLELIE